MARALAGGGGAAGGLAVQRDDLAVQALAQGLGPVGEGLGEGGGVEGLEEPVEGVVAGDAVGQAQEGLEPLLAGLPEVFHVIEALAADQQGAEGDGQEVGEFVFLGAFHAGIGQAGEDGNEAGRVRHCPTLLSPHAHSTPGASASPAGF